MPENCPVVVNDLKVTSAKRGGDAQSSMSENHQKRPTGTRGGVPFGSTFDEVFRSDRSVGWKIAGGMVVATVLGLRAVIRRDGEQPLDRMIVVFVVLGSAVIGAFLGAALTFKDVVKARMTAGRPVAFPLKLLFGYGLISLILVWFPLVIVGTIAVTILVLGP